MVVHLVWVCLFINFKVSPYHILSSKVASDLLLHILQRRLESPMPVKELENAYSFCCTLIVRLYMLNIVSRV